MHQAHLQLSEDSRNNSPAVTGMLGRGKVKQLLDNHHQTFVKTTYRATTSVFGTSLGRRLTPRKGRQKEAPVLPTTRSAPSPPPGPSCPDNAVNRTRQKGRQLCCRRSAGQAEQESAGPLGTERQPELCPPQVTPPGDAGQLQGPGRNRGASFGQAPGPHSSQSGADSTGAPVASPAPGPPPGRAGGTAGRTRGRAGPRRTHHRRRRRHLGSTCRR